VEPNFIYDHRKVPLSLLEFQQQLGEDFRLGNYHTLRMIG